MRVETEIGHFVLRPFVTEGLLPGIVACSHHLGRWHRKQDPDASRWGSAPVEMTIEGDLWKWRRTGDVEGSWWKESGVHQNITFSVHPDPISGMHCFSQHRDGRTRSDIHSDHARGGAETQVAMDHVVLACLQHAA